MGLGIKWWRRLQYQPKPEKAVTREPTPARDGVELQLIGGRFFLRLPDGERIGPLTMLQAEDVLDANERNR